MFIKQRQVRRSSRFTSKWARSSRSRRDYVASIYAMAVVQGFLCAFLLFGAFQSFNLMRGKSPEMASVVRYGVPAGIVVIALIILRAFIGNLRRGYEAYKVPSTPTRSDSTTTKEDS